jgi:diaminopimelate decarboxylase
MIYLNSTNNCYEIQGLSLCDIVQEFGAPLFVYDAQKIIDQYTKMTNALRGVKKVKINYACKALTNINILKLFKSLGAGLDAVSYQEILLGLQAGFEPDSIIFTPNSISVNELEAAIAKGVKMNIDNLETLEYMGMHHPEIPLCVRINPHIMAGGNANISVGHIDSKFGISIHQVPHIERLVESLGIHIEGVHMHTGSDILDVDVFAHAADLLFNVARRFENLQYIDFGSGFKVKYQEQDIETDIDAFGLMMTQKFNDFCQ